MKSFVASTVLVLSGLLVNACGKQEVQASTIVQMVKTIKADWQMIATESSVKFTAKYSGENFKGHFSQFETQIKFDPANLETAHVRAEIDLSSVDAGEIERTEALPGKDWFFVKSFPKAVFESTSFIHQGGENYLAQATLTLRGVTKEITLPFTLKIENNIAHMQGSLTLNRRDFDVGRGMWKSESDVGHQVKVTITVKAQKVSP
ncbi:MAG: YceI family protein [Robiginitomaculum sp.]|nr:YceI family protein [Robiginitomaculum sp.]